MNGITYIQRTLTVRGWPRMDLAALWEWSAKWKEHSADGERWTTGTTSNGGEWKLSKIFQKRYPNVSWPLRNAREYLPAWWRFRTLKSCSAGSKSCSCREIVFLRSQQLQFKGESPPYSCNSLTILVGNATVCTSSCLKRFASRFALRFHVRWLGAYFAFCQQMSHPRATFIRCWVGQTDTRLQLHSLLC